MFIFLKESLLILGLLILVKDTITEVAGPHTGTPHTLGVRAASPLRLGVRLQMLPADLPLCCIGASLYRDTLVYGVPI